MIVSRCTATGCNVLTMGSLCVEHDVPVTRTFVRGRPYPRTVASSDATPASVVSLPVPARPAAAAARAQLANAS